MTIGNTRALGVLFTLCIASACGTESPTDPDPQVTGVDVTLSENPADLGTTVQATASVQPAGVAQSVTWSISDTDVATIDADGQIELHLVGQVTITATSTADPSQSGSVTLGVECPDPRLVTETWSERTTWENWIADPACFDYVVQRDFSSNTDTLVIEPGTVVGFEEGFGLYVGRDGVLLAEGTEAEPILLTGTTKERGFWKGLAFVGGDTFVSEVDWVTVEYTSGYDISGSEEAGLALVGSVSVRIRNSTFRESSGYGVSLDAKAEILDPEGNAFTANALGTAWVEAPTVSSLRGATLTGNDIDEVVVRPQTIDGADWPRATYRILDGGSMAVDNGLLTLAAGSVLRFEAEQSFVILSGGGLNAVGTAGAPIVLTGTSPVRGHWTGLGFVGSSHAMNRLEYVTVEYGGFEPIGSGSESANLTVRRAGTQNHSNVPIVSSTFRQSSEYGLWLHENSGFPEFSGNTLTANALGPAYVHMSATKELLAGSTYTGNDIDEVVVETGSSLAMDIESTWQDLGVPFYLQEKVGTAAITAPLTLEPGVEILVEEGLRIAVSGDGFLTAEGTQQSRISISGKDGAVWGGLGFISTGGSLDFIDLTGGGSAAWGGSVSEPAVVTIMEGGSSATVLFGLDRNISGPAYDIAFSTGASFAANCTAIVWFPAGDSRGDHCL